MFLLSLIDIGKIAYLSSELFPKLFLNAQYPDFFPFSPTVHLMLHVLQCSPEDLRQKQSLPKGTVRSEQRESKGLEGQQNDDDGIVTVNATTVVPVLLQLYLTPMPTHGTPLITLKKLNEMDLYKGWWVDLAKCLESMFLQWSVTSQCSNLPLTTFNKK